MLKHLETEDAPQVIVSFGHAAGIQLFLTALKVINMFEPLTGDNYASETHRKYRISQLSPFVANVAAVKYDCPNEDRKVIFYLNEKPIEFSWCQNGACSWSQVQRMYKQYTWSDCRQTFCSGSTNLKRIAVLALLLPIMATAAAGLI